MTAYTSATPSQRRSERVSIMFGLEVSGTDSAGQQFSETAKTRTVSRYGCCLALPRLLDQHQPILLHRAGTHATTSGQIVMAMGTEAGLHLYGVGTDNSCESLWDIRFASPFHQKVLNSIQDGVSFVGRDRLITYWNDAAERLTGFSGQEAIGTHCFADFLAHVDEHGEPLCGAGCPLHEVLSSGQPCQRELFLRHKQGHRIPVRVRVLPNQNAAGEIIGAVQIFSDSPYTPIADRGAHPLARPSFLDPLSGLFNRESLQLKLTHALDECRTFGRLYGLLLFHLDGFQRITDSYVHNTADALLKALAKTLAQALRPADIVGRWAGEEFLVIMPDVDALELGDLAERGRVAVASSSVLCGRERISLTASIGATVLNRAESAESAIHRVEELLQQSKRSGGNRTTAG